VSARSRVAVVAALLIVALGIRVWHVQSESYRPINDSRLYLRLASEIAHLGSYSSKDPGAGGTKGPSAYFPPGYPYFLAAIDLIDGHRTPLGGAVRLALLSQAVLGAVIVGLIGLVSFELFGWSAALIALALAAVYPVLIELSGALLAENLLTAFVLAAVYAALRARRAKMPYGWIAGTGALTGLAALTHENGVVIVIALVFAVWTSRPRLRPRSLLAPAVLILAAALTIAPWTIRNAIVMHQFIPISDETGITLVGTYNPKSAADSQVPYKWRIYYGIPEDHRLVKESGHLTELHLSDRLQSQALSYIRHHPTAPLSAAFHNTLRMFELEGSFAWHASAAAESIAPRTADIGVAGFWILCRFGLAGAFTRLTAPRPNGCGPFRCCWR